MKFSSAQIWSAIIGSLAAVGLMLLLMLWIISNGWVAFPP